MSTEHRVVGNLRIDGSLFDLVEEKFLPGTSLQAEQIWSSFGDIVADLGKKNRQLLEARDERQSKIDARLAQWREMVEDPEQKIARPRQIFVGQERRPYVAMDQR